MVDQNTFLETLNSVKEIISTAEAPMKEEEILAYFRDMELDGAQKSMVIDYLTNPETYKTNPENSDVGVTGAEETSGNENADENINVYGMYLEELQGLQAVSKKELDGFYRLLLQGDDSVVEKISNAWLVRITKVAERYQEDKLLLEDLVQEGNIALLMELYRLCGSMEKSDVEELLSQAVETGMMNYAGMVRDEKEQENSVVGKMNLISAARNILTEENGKVPTLKELAEYTRMDLDELENIQDMIDEAEK